MGIGVIIRDAAGVILAALFTKFCHLMKPIIAEALALRRVMKLCLELGFSNVVFEGDSQCDQSNPRSGRTLDRLWTFD